MKNHITNSKGSMLTSYFLIGMLIIMVGMSSITLAMNDYSTTLSNSNAIKAYYLAEMGVEKGANNIQKAIDTIVLRYLEELKDRKMTYLKSQIEGTLIESQFVPPQLKSYSKQYLINEIQSLNGIQNNPIEEYRDTHSYKITGYFDQTKEIIMIKSIGIYNNTRKQIIMEIKLPYQVSDGDDIHGLPKIKIHPWEVLSYYQAIITE